MSRRRKIACSKPCNTLSKFFKTFIVILLLLSLVGMVANFTHFGFTFYDDEDDSSDILPGDSDIIPDDEIKPDDLYHDSPIINDKFEF